MNLWLDGTCSFENLSNEPLPQLIDGILDEGATVFLTGQPGTGKSFASVSLAAAIASGTPWNGRTTQAGRVLYVVAEDTPTRIRDRFLAWSMHNRTPLDFEHRLRYITSFDFSKPETVDFMADLVANNEIALVIVDTMFSASAGIDTESAKDVKQINEVIARVKAVSLSPVTFLMVAHANKSRPDEISGSLQLKGLADQVLAMTKRGGYSMKFDKNRHGDEALKLDFEIVGVDLPNVTKPVGVLVSAEVQANSSRTKNEDAFMSLLGQFTGWVATSELFKLAEVQGMGKTTFYAVRKALLEAERVLARTNTQGSELKASTVFAFNPVQNEQSELELDSLGSVRSVHQPYKGLGLNSEPEPPKTQSGAGGQRNQSPKILPGT
jgi:predicted ATP-dependent serine protease